MKFLALVLTFVSVDSARLGLLRVGPASRETAPAPVAARSLFEEDSAFLFRQLFGQMDGCMCMSVSMSMSMPFLSDAPSDAPSDVPSDSPSMAPTFVFDLSEGVALAPPAEDFQQAQSSKQVTTTAAPEASGLGAGTNAMIAVLSVAGVAVIAAVAARKLYKANRSAGSIGESSTLSAPHL